MGNTTIEWADAVWNPVTGCTKVSQGCKHCYAERLANRFWGERKFSDVMVHPERLEDPLKWRKPRRVFVNSMSDLFHENVPLWFILEIFSVMEQCPQHTFIILTKRPERIRHNIPGGDALPNVILGVSCEDQPNADRRISELLSSGWTGMTCVSCEPLLGEIDLRKLELTDANYINGKYAVLNALTGFGYRVPSRQDDLGFESNHLNWVIAGGESGPGARPMHPAWARGLRDQCQAAGVPFFFKQWGEWAPKEDQFSAWQYMESVGKKASGRMLDGREWNEFPATR